MSEIQRLRLTTEARALLYSPITVDLNGTGPFVYFDDHVADKAAAIEKLEAERVRLRECIEMILIPSLTAATGKPEYLGWWTDDIAIANLVLKETGDCKQALEEK